MSCHVSHAARGHRPRLELGDLLRHYEEQLARPSYQQMRTARALASCRTAALGGHVRKCLSCGHREPSYNSCRNRHCPKCQGLDEVRWHEAQEALLLPIAYHHVVFTIPEQLHRLFLDRPRLGYSLLFAAVAETLREVALRPKNLGARIGFGYAGELAGPGRAADGARPFALPSLSPGTTRSLRDDSTRKQRQMARPEGASLMKEHPADAKIRSGAPAALGVGRDLRGRARHCQTAPHPDDRPSPQGRSADVLMVLRPGEGPPPAFA